MPLFSISCADAYDRRLFLTLLDCELRFWEAAEEFDSCVGVSH